MSSLLPLSLAAPGWLLLGAALPLLLIAYLKRRESGKRVVSTLFLLKTAATAQPSPQKIRLPLRFFLELLALALLILAATSPTQRETGSRIALLIDSSLSMNAGSRFTEALTKAESVLENAPTSGTFSLFLSAPRLTPVGERSMSRAEALRLLSTLAPSAAPDNLPFAVTELAESGEYDEVVVVSDREAELTPRSSPAPGSASTVVTAKRVGAELMSNYYLTNVRLDAVDGKRQVFASVGFSGTTPVEAPVELIGKLLSSNGAILGTKTLTVSSDRESAVTFAIPTLPAAGESFRVELSHLGGRPLDAIRYDNTAWLFSTQDQERIALVVTPFQGLTTRFSPTPTFGFRELSPSEFVTLPSEELKKYPVVLFHQTAPVTLPPIPALFILPPAESTIVATTREVEQPTVTSWAAEHPVMTYLRLQNFTPQRGALLTVPPWARALLQVEAGPLLVAGEVGGVRVVATGFELLPFEGRKTPFLSVLTLNILSWLTSDAPRDSAPLTGASVFINPGEVLLRPSGSTAPAPRGAVPLLLPGVYTVEGRERSRSFAVNAFHPEESQTATMVPFEAPRTTYHEALPPSERSSVWWSLTAAALALLLLDLVLCLALRTHGTRLYRLYT